MQVRLPEDFYEKLEVAISDNVKSDDRRYLDFGEIPNFYTDTLSNKISIRKLPLVMNYRDVYLAANSKEKGKFQGKDINYHNLGKAAIAQIKEAINDPLYVVRSEKKGKRGETRIQIITEMLDYKENSIMVFVELDTHAQNNQRYINAHVINSAYGRRNIQKTIETAREQSNLLYEKRLVAREGIDTISSAFNNEPSNSSIPENEKKVNTSEKKVKNSFAGTLLPLENYTEEEYNYTKEQYESFGWATYNLLNNGQRKDFDTKFSQARNGYKTFRKTKSGELMIPVSDVDDPIFDGINNVIVYAKGTMKMPIITRVLEIDEYDETTLSDIRRDLYEVEKRGIQQKTGGIFRQYNPFNFGNYVDAQRNLRERQEHNNQLGVNRGTGSGTVAKTQSGVRSPFLKLINSLTYNKARVKNLKKKASQRT